MKPIRKILFNPGPATTTEAVKLAQLVPDICPREKEFQGTLKGIREDLLKVINADSEEYVSVLFGGSGTAAMESTISSVVGEKEYLMIIINGAYGKRMKQIAELHSINTICIEYEWGEPINFLEVEEIIKRQKSIKHIAMVHHETTTGILNSLEQFSKIGRKYNKTLILDAISSYAGLNIEINKTPVDYLMSTSNKCIQGMPGVGFIICNKKKN